MSSLTAAARLQIAAVEPVGDNHAVVFNGRDLTDVIVAGFAHLPRCEGLIAKMVIRWAAVMVNVEIRRENARA